MKKKGNGPHPLFAAIVLLAFQILPGPMDSAAMGKHLQMDVTPENSTVLYRGDGQSVIQIRVVAPDDLPLAHRPPLNLALVLDRSGSMAGEGKMEHVRQAAHMLVDRLGPDDLLSIVTYNNRVQVAVPSRRVTDRQFFHRVISRIQPGDRTFLSGGLEEGYRQVRRRRRSGFISRVILLSDGLANVGVTDSGRLARMTGSMYESGVSVSTFGMGYDFDEDLLASMASGG
ncbi:MAG: VWA domain-containing protein, partial [bacterium]